MIYRREIDGLRAVAVVPVILFHAGLALFSGGYVGVDVFFVISGYLITSILIGELEAGDFSIARFYERRARRILPALFFVMLCCIPFAWVWMQPEELKNFADSLVAVTLFASNILFWREEGYFAPSAELKPLLHTWSLAVEEQYYLLFPAFLLLGWRFGRNRMFWAIAGIAAVSLVASEWGWRYKPTANFYLAPTRAWELLTGSLCAFWLSAREQRAHNGLSLAGLALIVFAIFCYDETTPFPSIYALVPVCGTALIILFAGAGTWTARLLSLRPFVGIGLVSYSAYLWHQPLFAFARIRSIVDPPAYLMGGLAALSMVLAYLSWRFIEKPFRKGEASILPTRRTVFAASLAGGSAFLVCGLVGHAIDGAPWRTAPSGTTFIAAARAHDLGPNYGLDPSCESRFTLSAKCRTAGRPAAILWGDSYAMHLAAAITASPAPLPFVQHTKSQCAPMVDIAVIGSITPWRDCVDFNDKVLAYIKKDSTARVVILSSPFTIIDPKAVIYASNGDVHRSDQVAVVLDHMRRTASEIRKTGKKVVIVSPPPGNGMDLGKCLLGAAIYGEGRDYCNFARSA